MKPSPFTATVCEYVPPILSGFIQQADIAAKTLGSEQAALHDFRIALRKQRSWLKAYGQNIGIEKSVRKRVSALASATNDCRDLEVYADWLDIQLASLNTPSLASYSHEVHQQIRLSSQAAVIEIMQQWPEIQQTLNDALASLPNEGDESFARLAHARLSSRMHELQVQVDQITARKEHAGSARELHQNRISVKQVHYLLDAFKPSNEHCRRSARKLKGLQDGLGCYHDLCLFAATTAHTEKDHKHMQPLIRAAEKQRRECFRRLRRNYFSPPIKWLKHLQHSIDIIEQQAEG